jgi:hypothetical protein
MTSASVQAYQAARLAWEQARENAVGAQGPGSIEWAEWMADHPAPTFRAWLIAMRGQHVA